MYKGKKILGMIPARGGSKGLPGKNIKPINGKPLIEWTIDRAKESKFIDYFFVSTDSKKISIVSEGCGADVIDRPDELAEDDTTTFDVIKHCINTNNFKDYDVILLLEPTSPLRSSDDIDNAIKSFIDNYDEVNSLVSLGEIHMENPNISKIVKNGVVVDFVKQNKKITQRQQLDKIYFPYGVVYMSKIKSYLKYETFYQDKTLPYFIKRWQNYEIDDIYDFLCIETIMKNECF